MEDCRLIRLLIAPVLRWATHLATVLRDSPVMRDISRSDFCFRVCKRRILPIMTVVITPRSRLQKKAAE